MLSRTGLAYLPRPPFGLTIQSEYVSAQGMGSAEDILGQTGQADLLRAWLTCEVLQDETLDRQYMRRMGYMPALGGTCKVRE